MDFLPFLYIGLSVFSELLNPGVVHAKIVHTFVKGKHYNLQETSFVFRKDTYIVEILQKGSLGQSELTFSFVLIAKLKVDL